MFLETLPAWVRVLIWVVVAFVAVRLVATQVLKPILKFRETRYRLNINATGSISNPMMKYDSAGEMLGDMETGIVAQMENIGIELKKKNIDPMKDTTFQLLQNQRDKVASWKGRLTTNPLLAMADQTFYPMVKGFIPDIQKAAKRWIKDF